MTQFIDTIDKLCETEVDRAFTRALDEARDAQMCMLADALKKALRALDILDALDYGISSSRHAVATALDAAIDASDDLCEARARRAIRELGIGGIGYDESL